MNKAADQIYILGNGAQAPYGIGEIIKIIPRSHNRKIREFVGRWYNAPTLRLNSPTGPKMSITDDGQIVSGPEW